MPSLVYCIMGMHWPFAKRQNLRLVQIQSPCRPQNKCNWESKNEICFENGRKHLGKRRKCWLPAFSPFPKMFSKDSFLRVVKSWDCVGKSYAPFCRSTTHGYMRQKGFNTLARSISHFVSFLLATWPFHLMTYWHSAHLGWWKPSYPPAVTGGRICIRSMHNRK